jgi:D-arabinose 1-dehydrogenase-like Zn-dependent alcohol dehydrogenase
MSETTETPIECVAAFEAKGPMQPFSYVPRKLQPYEVHIKIEVCGVCSR